MCVCGKVWWSVEGCGLMGGDLHYMACVEEGSYRHEYEGSERNVSVAYVSFFVLLGL